MLHFANKPDKIFRILLEEALNDMLRVLSARDRSLAEGGLLYPKEMRKQVHALKAALADTTLYQLTGYHWFLLYEAVLGWCESVNEMPELSRVYTDYGSAMWTSILSSTSSLRTRISSAIQLEGSRLSTKKAARSR